MAAFLQPADPWIENTFFHATTFDSSVNPIDSSNNKNPTSESSPDKSQQNDEESQWDQTENTIPPGLLPSQQPLNELPNNNQFGVPSRQSKIVQIIHRGGSGWDGSLVNPTSINNNLHYCPPYVILHDGQFSTVAFLSQEAQRSIGMNVAAISNSDTKSSGYESDNSAASRRSLRVMMQRSRKISLKEQQQKITLKDKCLASINQYTVSTVRQCCSSPSSTHKKHSDVMISTVLSSLDIPISMHHQLAPLQHVFMCLYVTGTITVIGAENQGLIGESKDVHTSPKVRQVLRDYLRQDCSSVATIARKEYQYECFMRQLEMVHLYYQNKHNEYAMDNDVLHDIVSDWPWESRLSNAKKIGNVQSVLDYNNGMIEEVLDTLEEEDNVHDVGRASTGTVLAQWDLAIGEDADNGTSNKKEEARMKDKETAPISNSSVQHGNVEELIFNDEYIEDVLEFTQRATTPPRTDTNSATLTEPKECHVDNALFSPKAVPYNGIDQMIPSQSQDDDEDETSIDGMEDQQQQLLTQAETVDVSFTHSQSLHPEQYFSPAEEEDINNVKSQLSTPGIQHSLEKTESKKRKRVRHSQVIIESQLPITTVTRQQSDNEEDKDDAGHDDAALSKHCKTAKSSINISNDSDDDAWLKVAKSKKRHKTTSASIQSESQVAGEGSEENSPQDDAVGTVAFGCDSRKSVATTQEFQLNEQKEKQDRQTKKGSNDSSTRAKSDAPKVAQSNKSAKEFDLDQFLDRSKRFCRRS